MSRPKLYKLGRRKMTLEESLASYVEAVSRDVGIPMSELLDESVDDWRRRKGMKYVAAALWKGMGRV